MSSPTIIPPRLIQTARNRLLPPLARAAAASLRLLHPDWEYLFFDDADVARFVATEFPQYRRVFESFPHRIQRYDFFRYLAVLRHGGFYFDLDVFLSQSVAELQPRGCVFPLEELTLNRFLREQHGLDWELGNYAFGAVPGHPFVEAIVENCVRAQQDRRWVSSMFRGIPALFHSRFEVLYTTGPGLVTRTLVDPRRSEDDITVLFPAGADVCDERNWHRFGDYGVHLMEASWRSGESYLGRKLALRWENRQRRLLLEQSRALGPVRPLPVPTFA